MSQAALLLLGAARPCPAVPAAPAAPGPQHAAGPRGAIRTKRDYTVEHSFSKMVELLYVSMAVLDYLKTFGWLKIELSL